MNLRIAGRLSDVKATLADAVQKRRAYHEGEARRCPELANLSKEIARDERDHMAALDFLETYDSKWCRSTSLSGEERDAGVLLVIERDPHHSLVRVELIDVAD